MMLSHCFKDCGVVLPKNSLILPMSIATHWDQYFLLQEYQVWVNSTLFIHLVSFLMVSESRHGMNSTKFKPANSAFLLFSHILNNMKCTALLCLLPQQQAPREGSNKDLQNEQLNMTTDTVTQVRINKTRQSQEQCSEIHSVCCIIHQPLPSFVRQGYICFFLLCSQVHSIWRGKEHGLTPSPGQWDQCSLSLRGCQHSQT